MTVATAVAAGAAAGASPSASLVAGSNDERGEVSVTTGASGTAAGILATITFAGSWQGVGSQLGGPFVNLTCNGTNTLANALAQLSFQWNAAKTTLSIYCSGTPATAQTYLIDYNITG